MAITFLIVSMLLAGHSISEWLWHRPIQIAGVLGTTALQHLQR
jgi:hypothetical protein